MKKIITGILAAVLALLCAGGCDNGKDLSAVNSGDGNGLEIVTTIFPEYDWTKEIAGDTNTNVTLLLDNGVDLHSYQPTVEDILKISGCDLFIYVGGESDEWVRDALDEAVNKDMRVLNLLELLGGNVKEEELVEGMQQEREDDGEEYDEHVWLSLKNAEIICSAIAETLSDMDSDNAASYRANADEYISRLSHLDSQYEEAVSSASGDTLLFGDRFPFRYLTDDYGIKYYAAFAGCSAETEASFETILFLANKVNELGLGSIMQLESSDGRIAETIRQSTETKSQRILTLDSMQSTTSQDMARGTDYLTIMENNLAALKEALN